jgi:uncharacterized protein (DUF362 family)
MSKISHPNTCMSRRDFLKMGLIGSSALLASSACSPCPSTVHPTSFPPAPEKFVVSIVKIDTNHTSPSGSIGEAVDKAINLLGGFKKVLAGKKKIMLKPNLVGDNKNCTTNPDVVKWLAYFMQEAGKEVSIGEGSAVASGYNVDNGATCYTYDEQTLIDMQKQVFTVLGYANLAQSLQLPLVNLHVGKMVDVCVPGGLAYAKLTLHQSLQEIDLLCSVPMMKTHYMASVSLGMKNLIGLYPGSVYGTVRSRVHDQAFCAGSEGVAFEIIDMARVNKLGLTVIDASWAMEGNGPASGDRFQMNMIIAGTNTLATDMVAAYVMGYCPDEIPAFVWAHRVGMQPQSLYDIEVLGTSMHDARRIFKRPDMHTWPDERSVYLPCPGQSPIPTECDIP